MILCLAFVWAFTPLSSLARIIRVNNNPGISAQFSRLDSAQMFAERGDTIHLEGSQTSYGNFTLIKKLIILGPGYFLTQNPKTQALNATAIVENMTFNSGSEESVVMGLDFHGNANIGANKISIKRNRFAYELDSRPQFAEYWVSTIYLRTQSNGQPVSGIIISQNYGPSIEVGYASSSTLIFDNYITNSSGDNFNSLYLHPNSSVIVQNNIFKQGKVIGSAASVFTNNIMVSGSFEGAGTYVTNNLGNGTQFGVANGNKSNVNMSTVFVGLTGNSRDGQWRLSPNSPARNAGYGSTAQVPVDAGMFSGPSPYVLSGLPPIPSIYFLTTTPVGSNAIPLTVEVSVKSGG